MCSHSQSILLFSTKGSLAVYYLRSLCLCAFATRLALSAFAVRHLPEGILWTVDWGLVSVFCLLSSGFRAVAGGLRHDELSSVLYRLGINCQGWK